MSVYIDEACVIWPFYTVLYRLCYCSVSTEIFDWGFLYLLVGKVGDTKKKWTYKDFKHLF